MYSCTATSKHSSILFLSVIPSSGHEGEPLGGFVAYTREDAVAAMDEALHRLPAEAVLDFSLSPGQVLCIVFFIHVDLFQILHSNNSG